jgi:hypothetical protein
MLSLKLTQSLVLPELWQARWDATRPRCSRDFLVMSFWLSELPLVTKKPLSGKTLL